MQHRTSHTIYFARIFFQQKFQKVSKKACFGPFFTNKIFLTHKCKVVGHEKLVNIGPSDQVFIGGKVVLIPNNPAEESQVISFIWPVKIKFWLAKKCLAGQKHQNLIQK